VLLMSMPLIWVAFPDRMVDSVHLYKAMSQIKIRKYIGQGKEMFSEYGDNQLQSFGTEVINGLASNPSAKLQFQGLIESAIAKYSCFQTAMINERVQIERQGPIPGAPPCDAETARGDLRLKIQNTVYAKTCQGLLAHARKILNQCLKGQNPENSNDPFAEITCVKKATLLSQQAILEANLYADESYFGEGPLKDVVGLQQARIAALAGTLAGYDYLGSFNENVGDALKDLIHYGGGHGGGADKMLIQISKYCVRLFSAITDMGKVIDFGGPGRSIATPFQLSQAETNIKAVLPQLKKLRDAGSNVLAQVDTTSVGDLQTATADFNTAESFRSRLLDLFVRVNIWARKGKLDNCIPIGDGNIRQTGPINPALDILGKNGAWTEVVPRRGKKQM